MEDFIQILIYVGFLLIYLVSKLFKNRSQKPVTRMPEEEVERDFSDPDRPRRSPEVDLGGGQSGMDEPRRKQRRQPGTFEEILRELTGADAWEEASRQEQQSSSTYERQQEKARQQAESVTQQVKDKAGQYSRKLGDSVQEARQAKGTFNKKLKEIERLTEPVKQKAPYQKKQDTLRARHIAHSLRDPNSARQAIILSEIINRKYF